MPGILGRGWRGAWPQGDSPAGQTGEAARPPHPAGASPGAGRATGPQGQCQSVKGRLGSWDPKEELPPGP